MSYPKFKFTCGHTIDTEEANEQKKSKYYRGYHRLICPVCFSEIVTCRINVCIDCEDNKEFEFKKNGKVRERCDYHKIRYDRAMDIEANRRRRKQDVLSNQITMQAGDIIRERLIKTDMLPNPVITSRLISPCLQNCQVHMSGISKNNTTCVSLCEYRIKYIGQIEQRIMPYHILNIREETPNTRRSFQVYAAE